MNISMEHMDHILLQQVQQAQAAAAAHQHQQQHAQAQAQAHQHAQALQHHQQQQMLHAQAVAQHNAAQQHAHAQHLAQLSQQHAQQHAHAQHTQHTQHAHTQQQLAQHNAALSHAQHAHTHTQLAHALDVSAQHTQHTQHAQHTHGAHPSHAQHTQQHTQQQLAQHSQHAQQLAQHSQHAQHTAHTQHAAHTPHTPHTQHAQQLAQEAVASSSSSSSAVNNNNANNNNNSAIGSNEDPRLQVFRKLSKTLKPAVLLKSWQRVCMLVAGIEAQRDCPQASIAMLEKEIYDRYHGNVHRDPPVIGTVKRAIDDQLDCLALDKFGVKFPKDKISYVQMTAGMPGHTIWRYYKELVSDVANKINLVYRQCLCEDLSLPEGKSLYDALEETLRVLWTQNEEVRKERITKRDGDRRCPDDSDSERDSVTHAPSPMGVPVTPMGVGHAVNVNHGVNVGHPVGVSGAPMGVGVNVPVSVPVPVGVSVPVGNAANDERDRHGSGRKKATPGSLMNAKPFPGVGKYQPIAFLSFLLMGPPAGERCYARFALDAHLEAAPPRPRGVNVSVSPVGVGVGVSGVPVGVGVGVGVPVGVPVNALARGMMDDVHHYDGYLARSHNSAGGSNGPDRKRMKKDNGSLTGVVSVSGAPPGHAHAQAHSQNGTQGHTHAHNQQGMLEEENEAIRIFNAETAARAQRLEELKLALSLFPDDENIKAELKQFVDSQRRTSLSLSVSVDGVSGAVLPPM